MSAGAPETVFAPAKINLFLHVGEKRADGYHDICSLAAFADVGDHIGAVRADDFSLSISGRFATGLSNGDDNLVLRAARALQDFAKQTGRRPSGAHVELDKGLPLASGMGGGSSDAAATLKLLSRLWDLKATEQDLDAVARDLGADVPVCLRGSATLMQGVGEQLTPWPTLPQLPAVLVNPSISVATADVFRRLKERSGAGAPKLTPLKTQREAATWLERQCNDLEATAISIAPVIREALSQLAATPRCLLSRMSGSGATCFGLFEHEADATAASASLAARYPHWWVVPAKLR